MTAQALAALRSQMPYVDLTALERDGRLNRIDDLFTVDLLTRYVTWKLRENDSSRFDAPATASHQFA